MLYIEMHKTKGQDVPKTKPKHKENEQKKKTRKVSLMSSGINIFSCDEQIIPLKVIICRNFIDN